MSKFSEFLKEQRTKQLNKFFGEDHKEYGDSLSWTHYKDDENIIISTTNVEFWKNKDTFVLIVNNNKVVYLKEWQVVPIKNWDLQLNAYAVKLNKKYFRPYTLSFSFNEYNFEKEDSFEDLVECAKSQDKKQIKWKLGHYDCLD